MKFWISCFQNAGMHTYVIHSALPEWNGGCWFSLRRIVVCEAALIEWMGEHYRLPKPRECWEFSIGEEDVWIYTP